MKRRIALRLARFNTTLEVMDKRYFQGLPSPAAAALVAGLVWVMIEAGVAGSDVRWLACVLTVFAGVTMVTGLVLFALPVGIIATGFVNGLHKREFTITWSMVNRFQFLRRDIGLQQLRSACAAATPGKKKAAGKLSS